MRRDRLTCELVGSLAPLLAERGTDDRMPGVLAEHVGSCLRCQAELARHRRTSRALAALRAERLDPPPGAVAATLAAIEAAVAMEAATREALGDGAAAGGVLRVRTVEPELERRPAHVGGVMATAAGGAAAVAGVLVWRTSRRRALAG